MEIDRNIGRHVEPSPVLGIWSLIKLPFLVGFLRLVVIIPRYCDNILVGEGRIEEVDLASER